MATTILINGIDFTGQIEGIDELSVTFQKDVDTNTSGTRISNELTFRNSAFEYLEAQFFLNTSGGDRDVQVHLVTDCCGHEYDFFIRGDAVDYCPAICEITANLTERNEPLAILSNVPDLSDFGGFAEVPYCLDSTFIQVALYFIVQAILVIFRIIESIFNGDWAFINLLDELLDSLIGCNREKGAVNIKQYLQKCANDAGLTLSSTTTLDIDPYFNTYYVNSNNSLGNLSCIEFLELVKQPFNAEYLIKDGTLFFERVDFISQLATHFVNVDQIYLDGRSNSAPCYRYTSESKPAYGRFSYSPDNIDQRANELLPTTNDIVEFNDPFNPYQRGSFDKQIPFSPASFTDDPFTNPTFNNLRGPNQLVMSTDISENPKLVIGHKVGTRLSPQRRPSVSSSGDVDYTYQMWFDADLDVPELYQNFWFLADPRNTQFLPYQLDDFTFQATCDEMGTVYREGIDLIIETRLGDARANSITINYSEGTITLSGVQII